MPRFLPALAFAVMTLLAQPAAAQSGPVLVAPSIVKFWRTHPATVTTGDPSKDAQGTVTRVLPPPHVAARSPITPAEMALLKRRLQVVLDTLLEQPSLQDPRGFSVVAFANVYRPPTEDGAGALSAELSILGRRIRVDDPKTVRSKTDGRLFTPGEGVVVRVALNPTNFLQEKWPTVQPGGGTITALGRGASTMFLVTDAPIPADSTAQSLAERWSGDQGWTGGSGEAPMLVYLSSYRQENDQLGSGQLAPTEPAARLAAAAAMIDWPALRTRLLAVR